MNGNAGDALEDMIRARFRLADIDVESIVARRFPNENIVIVEVREQHFMSAVEFANSLDLSAQNAFVTVRRVAVTAKKDESKLASLADSRITKFIELIDARSRTSGTQGSLHYVQDVASNLNLCLSPRHNLIFGRRGVGKTALMLEAKRIAEERGNLTFWINIQTIGSLSASAALVTTASRLMDIVRVAHSGRLVPPKSVVEGAELQRQLAQALGTRDITVSNASYFLPRIQNVLTLLSHETQSHLYLFLDDIHYLTMSEQPRFLDMIHAVTRDSNVWIKAAGIKHQTRWFNDNPPVGLQTGHDAKLIELDITLEDPGKAKNFLYEIGKAYADEVGINSTNSFLPQSTIDRLVLASGGVPRDFLVLASQAIRVGQRRAKARIVGIQDVNEAAGQLAQLKIQELEQDAAASIGSAQSRVDALKRLSNYLLEEKQTTYFRIDYKDKEDHPKEYGLLQSLMDLRMIHLIHGGLSDEHRAGQRSEVYMLDLSRYSSSRFKHQLRVLDFSRNHLVLKTTGTTESPRIGDTPKRLLGILRRGVVFELGELTSFLRAPKAPRKQRKGTAST